jgi:acyl-CoA synthetase (AMP-forming)/AMP-acid ligase II
MNLTEPILRHGRMQPDAIALIERERTVTYGTLADLVLRTAAHLAALGIKQGDQVGICLKDDGQHVVAFLAVVRLGAVAVPIDWRARPAEKARVANAFALKAVLALPDSDIAAQCPILALDAEWHESIAAAATSADVSQDWHVPLTFQASSGSTGLPKFTIATHLQIYLHVACYLELVPSNRRHCFLQTLPHYFSAGRLVCMAHLMRGDTLVLYPSLFTAAEFLETAMRHNVTVGFVVPSMARQLLSIAGERPLLPQMDLLLSGGAPLFPDEKRDALLKLSQNFHEIYGTAAVGPISALGPKDMIERPLSVGRPFSLVDMEVVDDDERPLGPGIAGRLRFRGPGLTSPVSGLGQGASAEEFRNGWNYPGEIATVDPLGYIYLQGRTSEVIFRGGAKIFPAEVEAVLQDHDAVMEAAVVGRPSADNEQEMVAYVISRRSVAPGELLAHCRTRLTAYKVPRDIRIVSELPRNSSGKVDKQALKNRP